MNKNLSQCEQIIRYLRKHPNGLTRLQALDKFDCINLPGRICDLRENGYNIVSVWKEKKKLNGEIKRFVQYRLVER